MRTVERLTALKGWMEEKLCEGRMMKTPAQSMNITEIKRKEPEVYIAWAPARVDNTGRPVENETSTCPSITIMPNQAYAKYMEEKRFDRYNNVHRPSEMGQHLSVSILFSVYEPGTRMPGFAEGAASNGKGIDMTLMEEGTEQGVFTLLDWMDDCMVALLEQKSIPQTDLIVEEATMTYSLYTDQSFVVDRRPIYYGFINVSFNCYADEGKNKEISEILS